MNQKSGFIKKIKQNRPFLVVVLCAYLLSSLLFFTSLDNRFFDLFLRLLPSLTEDEKVYVLMLDDASMELAGGFPFRREVMADIVVLLKEFGVESIVFDLSYLDESAHRFDPDYAAGVLAHYLDSGFDLLEETAVLAMNGEFSLNDIHIAHEIVRDDLEESVFSLGRDVDDFFARALAFSGNSWLTLTFVSSKDVFGSEEYITNEEIDRYIAANFAMKNVINNGDTKTREMVGVMPAIQKLLTRAKGAGFVNAPTDRDGLRRRVELLFKYQDEYYGHLALAAMRERLGYTSIEVSNRAVTLLMEDGKTLRIPRAQDGTMLYKWPKKLFYDYQVMSLVEFIQYNLIERVFVSNLETMSNFGFFFYWDNGMNPL